MFPALSQKLAAIRALFTHRHVRVGVAVIAIHDGKILLGRRTKPGVGYQNWQCGGGHLDKYESIEDCAVREMKEETNLRAFDPQVVTVTNNIYKKFGKHYITIWVKVTIPSPEELRNLEPDKCDRWEWFALDALPLPMFEGSSVLTTENLRTLLQS